MTPHPPDDSQKQPNDPERPAPMVCFCRSVREDALLEALDHGARSVQDLIERTNAGTGCGTCRFDLERMVRERLDGSGDGSSEGSARSLLLTLLMALLATLLSLGLLAGCGENEDVSPDPESDTPGRSSTETPTPDRPEIDEPGDRSLPDGPGGLLTGRLIDPLGNPISSASVLRLSESPEELSPTRRGRSDSRGMFRVAGVARGDLVLVLADGFEPALRTATTRDAGTIELRSGTPLRVEVRSGRERRPVPGARLEFRPAAVDERLGALAAAELTRETLSDSDGSGFLRGLFPLAGVLRVEADGFAAWEQRLAPDESEGPIQVLLAPGRSVSGHLVDASGQAVSGAWIQVSPREGGASVQDETLINGYFLCSGAPSGPLELAALVDGVTIPLGDWDPSRSTTFRLPTVQRTTGRVLDAGGLPIASASVTRIARSGRRSRRVSTRGRFTFEGLPEGRIAVRASSKGFVPALRIVREPTTGPIELRLARARTAVGRVVDAAGRPVASARIRIVGRDGMADPATLTPWASTRTSPDGGFSVAWALPEDEARVLVEPIGGPPTLSRVVLASTNGSTSEESSPGPLMATDSAPEIDCGTIRIPVPGRLRLKLDEAMAPGSSFRLVQTPAEVDSLRPALELRAEHALAWDSGPIGPGTYRLLRTPGPFERSVPGSPLAIELRPAVETTIWLHRDAEPTIEERPLASPGELGSEERDR